MEFANYLAQFTATVVPIWLPGTCQDMRRVKIRGVAQWLARFVRDEEVGGSNPLTPTIHNETGSGNRRNAVPFCYRALARERPAQRE